MYKKYLPILGFAVVFIIGIVFAYQYITGAQNHKLKVWSPNELNPDVVDPSMRDVTRNHKIADFKLVDQNGDTITNANYKHRIYIADFFFTTCTNLCPKLTAQMKRVYDVYKNNPKVAFLSHTVTPEIDSVPVLKAYAEKYGAKAPQWEFVTGPKKEIYDLARKSYFAATTTGNGGPDDFIHTQNIVLVDTNRRIRGYYDGIKKKDVDRLIKDIKTLLKYH